MDRDRVMIGAGVVYRPPHLPPARWEAGVVTRVTERGVFVRYGNDGIAKLTSPEDLEPIRLV